MISNTVTVIKSATGDLRARLADHRSSVVEQAALAVKLARIAAVKSATYHRSTGARHVYDEDPTFRAAFNKARARIRAMRVRYVVVGEEEEADGMRQALLEIYAAVVLRTLERDGGFNSFRNH